MPTISELVVKIVADTTGLDKGIKGAKTSVGDFGDTTKSTTGATGKFAESLGGLGKILAGGAIAGGIIAAAKAAIKLTDEFGEAEIASRRLDLVARMNNIPEASVAISNLADEVQKLTGADGDLIKQLGAELIAQGKTLAQTQSLIKAATQLSAITGDDLSTSVKQLNNTYSGMAGTLGKSIPAIKELTTEQLKNGDAIDIINTKYKGYAEQLTDTTLVAKNRMKEALSDLREQAGSVLAPLVTGVRNGITATVESYFRLEAATSKALASIGQEYDKIVGPIGDYIDYLRGAKAETDAIAVATEASTRALIDYNNITELINEKAAAKAGAARNAQIEADRLKAVRAELIKNLDTIIQAGKTERQKIEEQIKSYKDLSGLKGDEEKKRQAALAKLNADLDAVIEKERKAALEKKQAQAEELLDLAAVSDSELEAANARIKEAQDLKDFKAESYAEDLLAGLGLTEQEKKSIVEIEALRAKAARTQEQIWKDAADDIVSFAKKATDTLSRFGTDANANLSAVIDIAADAAIKSGEPTMMAIGAVVKVAKAAYKLLVDFDAEQKRQIEAFQTQMASVESSIVANKIKANEQALANTLKRYDEELEAYKKTAEYQALTDEQKAAKDDEYAKKKKEAEEAAAKAIAKLAYDKAVLDQKIAVAQAKIQQQKAISDLGWGNKKEKDEIRAMYAELISSIQSIPLPAYASGTSFARGGPSIVGENGPEIVNMPRGASVIPNYKTQSQGVGGVVVNIYSPVAVTPSEASSIFKQTARNLSFQGAM